MQFSRFSVLLAVTFVYGSAVFSATIRVPDDQPTMLSGINEDDPDSSFDDRDGTRYDIGAFPLRSDSLCRATGNIDGDPSGIIDIMDLTYLIDVLFINHPPLPMPFEADINGDCIVDRNELLAILECWTSSICLPEFCGCDWGVLTCCDPLVTGLCCIGPTGNIDGDQDDKVDISDLTFLIDHLFINFPPLVCPAEGNVDGDPAGIVDIADLTFLIDHLFINFPPTAACQ